MNRRSFLKWLTGSLLTLFGASTSSYYYASEIEPATLEINKSSLESKKIPSAFHNFNIVQFSDTHVGFQYTIEQLNDLVNKINALKPDIIVFTGDLIDDPSTFEDDSELINSLRLLHATYGKYWVYGNHDHGGYGTDSVRNIMDSADFTLLKNSHKILTLGNDQIIIAGIDDAILGRPNLGTALLNTNDELFTILLAHEPDFVDVTKDYPVDLQLSGHSHGGQVRLPFIGHLYTPTLAEKYTQGEYHLNNGDLFLYVTNGIGTTRLPLRFFCKPELYSLTLKSLK